MDILSKRPQKILSINFDAEINSLVYVEILGSGWEVIGYKIIDLFEVKTEEKEKYLINALVNTLKEYRIWAKQVYISINGPGVYLSRLVLPSLPAKEIPDVLNWQLKGKIPFPIEEVIFDYELIKETTEEDGTKKIHLLVAGALKKELEHTCEIVEKAGLLPRKVNLSPFCLNNLIYCLAETSPDKIYGHLEIGWQGSLFSLYHQKKVIFSRPVLVGMLNLIHGLETSIIYAGNRLSLSSQQAYQVLKEVGLPQELSGNWQGFFPYSQLIVLMRPELEKLSIELNRSLEYFAANFPEGKTIEKIYVSGPGAEISGLSGFLAQQLKIEIEILSVTIKGLPEKGRLTLYTAIGNVLSLKGKVNLVPLRYRLTWAAIVEKTLKYSISFMSIFLLFSTVFLSLRIQDYRNRLKFFSRERQTMDQLILMHAQAKALEEVKNTLTQESTRFDWIMKELSRLIPVNIVLSNLSIESREKSINITGIIFASLIPENSIVGFMRQIEKSPLFKTATLNWIKKERPNQAEFKLTLGLP